MLASEKGHDACLQLLIAAGADVEEQDQVSGCERVLICAWECFTHVWDREILLDGGREGERRARKGCELCGQFEELRC